MKKHDWRQQRQEMVRKLNCREKFSFARYGDGEWNAVFGMDGQNCDGHAYFQDMGTRLTKILLSIPDYWLGEASISHSVWGIRLAEFMAEYPQLRWVESDMLHLSSIDNTIWPFFDALKRRDVLFVAPERLHTGITSDLMGFTGKIAIPEQNCWLEYERIHKEIEEMIFHEDLVIVYSASMMANVLIDDFSNRCTNIDAGSLFDPYNGFITRSHHKKIKSLQRP